VGLSNFTFKRNHGNYLLFINYDNNITNLLDAICVAEQSNIKLVIAYHNQQYFDTHIKPNINGKQIDCYKLSDLKLQNKLIGGALALLLPIKSNSHVGLLVAESFACGTPVIAYKYGALSELVDNGVTGYLVNTIEEAVNMVGKVRSISRSRCREEAERRFSKEQMVDKYISLYSKVLEDNKREDHRPWGYYEILSSKSDYKVKRIIVKPNKRLSLQRHRHRSEHWYIVKGRAIVTLNKDKIPLEAGEAVDIPKGTAHRISNEGNDPLIFIEVQTGTYFGEDDIERLEDDFGRN
jgi:mannose-6-phosphate isomerase-like protein (cupin superfamily)